MTLTIEIKPEIEDILRRRGMTDDRELADYVGHLIEEDNSGMAHSFPASNPSTSIVEETFGATNALDRSDLIVFAESEEFSGY